MSNVCKYCDNTLSNEEADFGCCSECLDLLPGECYECWGEVSQDEDVCPHCGARVMITLVLKPHIERGGYHLDRFDAFLDDELIVTSVQPIFDGARALLKRGYDPELLMCVNQKGHIIFKRTIGENAKWTVINRSNDDKLRLVKFNDPRASDRLPLA